MVPSPLVALEMLSNTGRRLDRITFGMWFLICVGLEIMNYRIVKRADTDARRVEFQRVRSAYIRLAALHIVATILLPVIAVAVRRNIMS